MRIEECYCGKGLLVTNLFYKKILGEIRQPLFPNILESLKRKIPKVTLRLNSILELSRFKCSTNNLRPFRFTMAPIQLLKVTIDDCVMCYTIDVLHDK